jgi:hypothetical protein
MKQNDAEYNINSDLGEYVGEYIVRNYLPKLSVFGFTRNSNTVDVDDDDMIEYKRYERNMWVNGTINSEKHKEYVEFFHQLERKYLPNVVKCMVRIAHYTNLNAFLEGVSYAIWDSDVSSYDIDITEEPEKDYRCNMMFINIYLHDAPTKKQKD